MIILRRGGLEHTACRRLCECHNHGQPRVFDTDCLEEFSDGEQSQHSTIGASLHMFGLFPCILEEFNDFRTAAAERRTERLPPAHFLPSLAANGGRYRSIILAKLLSLRLHLFL